MKISDNHKRIIIIIIVIIIVFVVIGMVSSSLQSYTPKSVPNLWTADEGGKINCTNSLVSGWCIIANLDDAKDYCNKMNACTEIWARPSWVDNTNRMLYQLSYGSGTLSTDVANTVVMKK